MVDAIKEACGVDFWKEMTLDEAKALAKEHDIEVEKIHNSVGHIINLFFEKYVEETIVQPTLYMGILQVFRRLPKRMRRILVLPIAMNYSSVDMNMRMHSLS